MCRYKMMTVKYRRIDTRNKRICKLRNYIIQFRSSVSMLRMNVTRALSNLVLVRVVVFEFSVTHVRGSSRECTQN